MELGRRSSAGDARGGWRGSSRARECASRELRRSGLSLPRILRPSSRSHSDDRCHRRPRGAGRGRSQAGSPSASAFATSIPGRCTAPHVARDAAGNPLLRRRQARELARGHSWSASTSRAASRSPASTSPRRSAQSRIDRLVPVVARHPAVRTVMRERQRELADLGDAVIEGRTSARSSARTRT